MNACDPYACCASSRCFEPRWPWESRLLKFFIIIIMVHFINCKCFLLGRGKKKKPSENWKVEFINIETINNGSFSCWQKKEFTLSAFVLQFIYYSKKLIFILHGIIEVAMDLSQVLLDTSGTLKYADFGLSKVEGENLQELFFKFAEAGEHWNIQSADEMMKQITTSGLQIVYPLEHLDRVFVSISLTLLCGQLPPFVFGLRGSTVRCSV